MPVVAGQLIVGAQELSGLGADYISRFISTRRWGFWLDEAVEELAQLFIASGGADNFVVTAPMTLTASQNWATLGAGGIAPDETPGADNAFRQLIGVTRTPSQPQRRTVHRFNFAERDSQWQSPRYRLMGSRLYIEPMEQAAGDYLVSYVRGPVYPYQASAPLDDCLTPHREFLMVWMAIQALTKEKSSTAALETRLAALAELVETNGTGDVGEAESITDVVDDGGITWR